MQEDLKKAFGEESGRLNPDFRPEFNRGWEPDPD
jgi:hypothetical protein